MSKAIDDIVNERARQINAADINMEEFDKSNSRNDWIAYINAYTGRAADKVFRNAREGQQFRDNMVKAGALIIAAIEAYDKEYI